MWTPLTNKMWPRFLGYYFWYMFELIKCVPKIIVDVLFAET